MITFTINKDDIIKTFECSLDDSIIILKKKIMSDFNLNVNYIDLDFQLERPIRELGKFNLESGIIPRTLDGYTFNRYGLDGKNVPATFHEVLDYQSKKYERSFKHINLSQKYKGSTKGLNDIQIKNENVFDLASEDDFPPLS